MRERSRELRDRTVWVLSRLSLAMLLAMMAALFIGSGAEGHTSTSAPEQASAQAGVIDGANPLGLVLVVVVVVVGLGVLAVGASKPHRRTGSRDLAELLRD